MEQIQIVSRTRVRVIFVLRFIRRRKDDNVDIIIGTLSFPPFVETEQFFFFSSFRSKAQTMYLQ